MEQTRRYAARKRLNSRMRSSATQLKRGQAKQEATSSIVESMTADKSAVESSERAILAPGTPPSLSGAISSTEYSRLFHEGGLSTHAC